MTVIEKIKWLGELLEWVDLTMGSYLDNDDQESLRFTISLMPLNADMEKAFVSLKIGWTDRGLKDREAHRSMKVLFSETGMVGIPFEGKSVIIDIGNKSEATERLLEEHSKYLHRMGALIDVLLGTVMSVGISQRSISLKDR